MINIFWHRRDLRIEDNAGLYRALKAHKHVQPIFIFDTNILDKLDNKSDARVSFLYDEVHLLREKYQAEGSDLWIFYGKPIDVYKKLLKNHDIHNVYTNRDYEPYALERDQHINELLDTHKIKFKTYKDHVIFEQDEVLKKDNTPYTVFTPYKRKWLEKLDSKLKKNKSYYLSPYPNKKYINHLYQGNNKDYDVSLNEMGFSHSDINIPTKTVTQKIVKEYADKRNFPALDATSKLGIHFRFGTISIREKSRKSRNLSDIYLSELIWRDFYSQILANFPHVATNAFRAKYEKVEWRYDEGDFKKWCDGKTGYPLVDAGMRELNTTGHMHNRVRMVVASFLTKHLLLDWRWGEAYFAKHLLDFDLASNNGGWQWAAGCGTDAAPYFRIFNPTTQFTKFDKEQQYVKQWVKELGTADYPEPIVEHKFARERCLAAYKAALNGL